MAGQIAKQSYVFDVKKSSPYHEKTMDSTKISALDDYVSRQIDESTILQLLQSDVKRNQALNYLNEHFHNNNSVFIFQNKAALFKGFSFALQDNNTNVRTECTKLIAKIIPQLGPDLDIYMHKVLSKIVSNVGDPAVSIQKESIQTLHLYMKHSNDIFKILHTIAYDGIQHKDPKTRRQVIHSFPTLLFSEFKNEDFFDIVHSLVNNLTEIVVDRDIVLKTIEKVKQFISREMFDRYIERLPTPLQMTYANFNFILESKRVKKSDSFDFAGISSGYARGSVFDEDSQTASFQHPRMKDSFINKSNIKNEHSFLTLSIIPSRTMELLTHAQPNIRYQACIDLKILLTEVVEASVLRDQSALLPLISSLQPLIEDKDWKVSCAALQTFSAVVDIAGSYLKRDRLSRIFISALIKRLGNNHSNVRSEFMKCVLQLMGIVGPQAVIDMYSSKLENRQAKVREDTINVITAALLSYSLAPKNGEHPIDLEKVCNLIAPSLMDTRPNVRKATLDCFAVIAHILGPDIASLYPINNAVSQVEIQHNNASGIISAVHCRLMRKQLPRLNEKMQVEYAVYQNSMTPISMSTDMQWIHAAKPVTNRAFEKKRAESQAHSKSDYFPDGGLDGPTILTQPRRHLSAGKQRQFPWSDKENPENGTHPSSAPVKYQNHGKTIEKPPFKPRNTWGPESEIASPMQGLKNKSNQSFDSVSSPGPTYGEIHNRKKQQSSKPSVRSSSIAKNASNNGYKPSFAASANNQFSSTSNQDPTILSSSCPSSFFEKNTKRPIQYRPLPSASEQSPTSSARQTDQGESPIMVKPALARSATKNRDLARAQIRKDVLKIDDNISNIPMKLSNTSASPRFDRMVSKTSSDGAPLMRPLNTKLNFSPSADFNKKFSEFQSKPLFSSTLSSNNSDLDLPFALNDTASINTSAYSPSTKSAASPSSSILPTKHVSSTSVSTNISKPVLSNGNNNNSTVRHHLPKTVATRGMHSPIQSNSVIFPSNDSSASDAFAINEFESKVSSIRRSAQNRRQRMRSQPALSEESVRRSPTDVSIPSFSSQIFDSGRSSQNSLIQESLSSASLTSSVINKSEPPPLMYNPNNGATFHQTKKVDSSLSVVGGKVGYSGGRTDSGIATNSSSAATGSQISSALKNSSFSQIDKNKSFRGSPFGAQQSSASEIINDSFNVQGIGVFSSPSSAASLEQDNTSSTPSTEDIRAITGSESDPNLLLDGIFGRAVINNSSEESFSKPIKSNLSQKIDGEVSLSASLRIRHSKKKESFSTDSFHSQSKGSKSPEVSTFTKRSSLMGNSSINSQFDVKPTDSLSKTSSRSERSENMNSYSRDRLAGNKSAKTGQGSGFSIVQKLPLDHPERSLSDAVTTLETAGSEEWESITESMVLIQRIAAHHPSVLASRYHDVIVLLSKNVHNLRSQVARTSVVALTDIYSHAKKSVADQDLEISVQALITEFGKMNVFMRDEIDKALQSALMAASTAKFLSALLNTGQKHKNKTIRSSTARCCLQLVNKIGPDKALSGQRDITERLLDAVSGFVCDSSPDVRQSGKTIIQSLMNHPSFETCLDKFLSAKLAQDLRDCAASIKQRGLGSGSVGSRKSSMRRGGTNSASLYKSSQSSSASVRRKTPGSRGYVEMDYEEVKSLCAGLSGGNFKERKDYVDTLHSKIKDNKPWVEDNILKIMDAYNNLLTTSNTKINLIGLRGLPLIIDEVGNSIRESLGVLVPALLKLSQSKQHGEIALSVVDHLISKIDHIILIPYLANMIQYGTGKSKPIAMEKLTSILQNVPSNKLQVVERQVLPTLTTLLSPKAGTYTTRHEATQFTHILYELLGQRLLDYAESRNISDRVKDILEL